MQYSNNEYNNRRHGLWDVHDIFLKYPDEKLRRHGSPLVESTIEAWGHGQFDNARVPQGLIDFVYKFTQMLGLVGSQYSSVERICQDTLIRLDYEQPYFCLVDCLIQLSHNETGNTYRHKKSGMVLDPTKTETFKIEPNWNFLPYVTVQKMMEHPGMVAFLRQNVLPPQFKDRDAAMMHILEKVSEIVYGKFGWFQDFVDESISQDLETWTYHEPRVHSEHDVAKIEFALDHDRPFRMAAQLAVMTWLKSPKALPWLHEYHVIYGQLLEEVGENQVAPRKGAVEVVICGYETYTHLEVDFIPGRAPDTCICCNALTHCTKLVNLTALEHPMCSCGKQIDPLDEVQFGFPSGHYYNSTCGEYNKAHPPKVGYACQRCIFAIVHKQTQHSIKCGRAVCPATNCPHHMGAPARLHALTQQRTNQLTGATSR